MYMQDRCMFDNIVSVTDLRVRLAENLLYLADIGMFPSHILECSNSILQSRISLQQLAHEEASRYVRWNISARDHLAYFDAHRYSGAQLAAVRSIDDLIALFSVKKWDSIRSESRGEMSLFYVELRDDTQRHGVATFLTVASEFLEAIV
jgi:hypothetical protein